ncbi:MAG TPA: DUF87 domain-containing protein [Rhizomicrobium sp.]|nr:DUF87 domain-containing protein [Rhizomicrobium sp.]
MSQGFGVLNVSKSLPSGDVSDKSAGTRVAQIVSVSGSQAVGVLDGQRTAEGRIGGARVEIGAMMKVVTPHAAVVAIVSAITCPIPDQSKRAQSIELIELILAGEIKPDRTTRRIVFKRGVASAPSVGDGVYFATSQDLELVYANPDTSTIDVGHLYQDERVPARLVVDELFGKHFIVVGATGCGKSSAVSCILQAVLREHHSAHIVVLDIHHEYPAAFGGLAELIEPSLLRLPFWMMNFEELALALVGDDEHRDAEVEILGDAVLAAKRRYSDSQAGRLRRSHESGAVTVDSPLPFRLSDVTAHIDEHLGRLERTHVVLPLRRLKNRIETLVNDPRFGFMFGSLVIEDTMGDILGRIFRIPIDGRPITVINLALVPAEILDIVISVISRLAFDLAVCSEGAMPMLLVCEEAHRYAPATADGRFLPTRRALARIAKEGRKYGISLALITQRPSELDQTILSQCSTVVAMRLTTERDQQVIRANSQEGVLDFLDFLPLLADREAIILGQGVAMAMRVTFKDIGVSGSLSASQKSYSTAWKNPTMNREALDGVIRFWRRGSKS